MNTATTLGLQGQPLLLEDLIEELTSRLQAGEAVDLEACALQNPDYARELRELFPALQVLAEMSGPAGHSKVGHSEVGHSEMRTGQLPGEARALGDFRLIREVGRGGMGVVYEAEQLSLGRRVALKVLPLAATMDPRHLQRFHNEARAAAALDHPHIVHVHAVGQERAVHFYAMQYIEGQTLATLIADLRQRSGREPAAEAADSPAPSIPAAPPAADTAAQAAASTAPLQPLDRTSCRRAAEWGLQAAEALEHAHQTGIVHRDIKPANLLIDGSCHLWVTDFGLAQVQTDTRLTITGDVIGTLRYMSPEQALAKPGGVDHRTDIYSLGATIYELLTLEPVFDGPDRQTLLRQVAFDDPRPPRRLRAAIPPELETIVLKALAKQPAERYAAARDLADDLRRFLGNEPIRARRPSLLQRARKWSQRHRALVWSAATSAALLLVMAVVLLAVSNERIARKQQQTEAALLAEKQALAAETRAKEALRRNVAALHISLANKHWWAGEVEQARQHLRECPADLRDHDWFLLQRSCEGELLHFRVNTEQAGRIKYSPDGRLLAVSAEVDGPAWIIRICDATTGRVCLNLTGHRVTIEDFVFSPDSQRLISVASHGLSRRGLPSRPIQEGKIWDLASGEVVGGFTNEVSCKALQLSPDGRLFVGLEGVENLAKVRVWDSETGRVFAGFPSVTGAYPGVTWAPSGKAVAITISQQQASLADLRTGQATQILSLEGLQPFWRAFSPDGHWLAVAVRNRLAVGEEIRLWDLRAGREAPAWQARVGESSCVAFSPDSRRLAWAHSEDMVAVVADADTGQIRYAFRDQVRTLRSLAFSPDSRRLATLGIEGSVRVWDVSPLAEPLAAKKD